MLIPQQEPATSTLELIAEALHQRAELAESRIDLDTRNLNNKTVRNAMLPTLDAFAYYGGSGVGGDVARPTCSSTITSDCFNPKNAAPPFVTGGPVSYPGTLKQLVNGTAPDKGVGLTLNIPLRNRQAQANQVRAQLEYRQAQVRQHQLENQVRIEVRNAQFDVKQNRAAVQAALSLRLSSRRRESVNSEEEKLKVGLSTQTAVLQQSLDFDKHRVKSGFQPRPPMRNRALSSSVPPVHCWNIPASMSLRPPAARSPSYPACLTSRPVRTCRLQPLSSPQRLRQPPPSRGDRCNRQRAVAKSGRENAAELELHAMVPFRCSARYPLPVTLSVVIITYNEEANIGRALESVMPLLEWGQRRNHHR